MNSRGFAWRSLYRDLKAGELTILLFALIVAVTSMTAVGFFTDRVSRAVEAQAAETLAADLVIRSPARLDERYLQKGAEAGLQTAETYGFPTVAIFGEEGRSLSVVNAVSSAYPLRGKVLVSDQLFGESYVPDGIPERATVWAEPGLMARLGVEVGDTIKLGAAEFLLTRVLDFRPDQNMGFTSLAPSVLVHIDDVPGMDVIRTGSRVTYRQLFAGEQGAIEKFKASISAELSPDERLNTIDDASEQITAAVGLSLIHI